MPNVKTVLSIKEPYQMLNNVHLTNAEIDKSYLRMEHVWTVKIIKGHSKMVKHVLQISVRRDRNF